MTPELNAALRLHRYLVENHVHGSALVGPDPGIRFAYRIGRFIKSYLPSLPWRDDYYYLQGQGYWALANWELYDLTHDPSFRQLAIDASLQMLDRQRPDGAWDYPHVEWRGRVATVEGIWASMGLIESYRRTGDQTLIDGVLRWHQFLERSIGYRPAQVGHGINYFAGRPDTVAVPNNSACALRYLAELSLALNDARILEPAEGMVQFLDYAQKSTGEQPYTVDDDGEHGQAHFQCYQYNAFQLLDLDRFAWLTGNEQAATVASNIARFLRTALEPDGHAAYACQNRHGAVTYHAAVVGCALQAASDLEDDRHLSRRAFTYVLDQQAANGSIPHSRNDYGLIQDRRSYPRYQAMMIYHLAHSTKRALQRGDLDASAQPVLNPFDTSRRVEQGTIELVDAHASAPAGSVSASPQNT